MHRCIVVSLLIAPSNPLSSLHSIDKCLQSFISILTRRLELGDSYGVLEEAVDGHSAHDAGAGTVDKG